MNKPSEIDEQVLSKTALRKLDAKAIKVLGIPEELLIENAARGLKEVLIANKIDQGKIYIFSGTGNNGADSLALCRHLLNAGADAEVFLVRPDKAQNKHVDFQLNILQKILPAEKINVIKNTRHIDIFLGKIVPGTLIIDGIFGIGFKPPLDVFYKRLFYAINKSPARIVAVDIPSGLACDTADVDQAAIKADYTVSFISLKKGFLNKESRQYTGRIFVKDIGISRRILENL